MFREGALAPHREMQGAGGGTGLCPQVPGTWFSLATHPLPHPHAPPRELGCRWPCGPDAARTLKPKVCGKAESVPLNYSGTPDLSFSRSGAQRLCPSGALPSKPTTGGLRPALRTYLCWALEGLDGAGAWAARTARRCTPTGWGGCPHCGWSLRPRPPPRGGPGTSRAGSGSRLGLRRAVGRAASLKQLASKNT